MTSTNNITIALIFLVSVSGIFFLVQTGIENINPSTSIFYDKSNTYLNEFGNSNNLTVNSYNSSILPDAAQSVSPENNNFFTDSFNTAKNWFLSTPAGYIIKALSAPYAILANTGLPKVLVYIIGSMFYGVFLFLIVSWLLNR